MKMFQGWRIVIAGGSLQFLQSLLLNQAFGVYLAVLVEEKGWSKTAVAGAAALKSTEVAVLGPVLGWMVDRWGPQGIVRVGILLFGLGFILLGQIETRSEEHTSELQSQSNLVCRLLLEKKKKKKHKYEKHNR